MKQKKKRNKQYQPKPVFDLRRLNLCKKEFLDTLQAVQLAIEMKLPRGVMNRDEKEAACFLLNFFGLILTRRKEIGIITEKDYEDSGYYCLDLINALVEVVKRSNDKGVDSYGSTGDELHMLQDGFADFIAVLKEEIEERPQMLLREWNATIHYCNEREALRKKEDERRSQTTACP